MFHKDQPSEVQQELLLLVQLFEEELRIKDKKAAALVIHKAMEEVIHSIKIFGTKIPERRVLKELEDMISRYLFF